MKKISLVLLSIVVVVLSYFTYLKADTLFFKVSKTTAKKDENISLTLDLNSISYDKFNIIISSSENVSVLSTNDINMPIIDNNEISFDIDKLSMNIPSITFEYKVNNTLHEGDTVVFTAKVTEIVGENETPGSMTEYVTITIEKDKQDNPENPNQGQKPTNKPSTTNKTNSFTRVSSNGSFSFSKQTKVVTYNGSDNNYLNSLKIKGYSFTKAFQREKTTYFVTVKNKTTKLNLSYTKSSSKANVVVTGNSGFKVGVNKVLVTVNAENGESRVYRIYVTREAKNE